MLSVHMQKLVSVRKIVIGAINFIENALNLLLSLETLNNDKVIENGFGFKK